MGQPHVENILKSGAVLWRAPLGEPLPDATTVTAGDGWGGNWERVGYTKTPLVSAYEATDFDIEVEEHLAPIDRRKVSHQARFETTLAEVTGDYLQTSAGGSLTTTAAGPAQAGNEALAVADETLITKYVWGFEGVRHNEDADALPIRMFFTRATSRLSGTLEFSKKSTDYTGIPLQIKALADPDLNGQLFSWYRVTALPSS